MLNTFSITIPKPKSNEFWTRWKMAWLSLLGSGEKVFFYEFIAISSANNSLCSNTLSASILAKSGG